MLSFVQNTRAGELKNVCCPRKSELELVMPSDPEMAKLLVTMGTGEVLKCELPQKVGGKVRTGSLLLPSDSEMAKLIITTEIFNSQIEPPLDSSLINASI